MLLKNGLVLKGHEVKKTDVLIEEGKIKKIGRDLKGEDILDVSKKLVMPGLVNTHTHLAMSLLRGYADDLELMDWLENYIWPLEKNLRKEDVYYGSMLGAIEMIKTGTVCFNDMYYHPLMTKKTCEEIGIKALLSSPIFDFGDEEVGKRMVREASNLVKKSTENVRFAFGPHAIYTNSKETLLKVKESAKGEKIHTHLSETLKEVKDCEKLYGKSPVEYLDSIGFLDSNVLAAHLVWLSKREMRILKKRGVKVLHCPSSNMKLSSGISPVTEFLKKDINVSLGTDGACSNNSLDMFSELKMATLLQKISKMDPTVLNVKQTLQLATTNASKALGFNSGLVEVLKDADLITLDLRKVGMIPRHSLLSNLVYSARGEYVSDVIISGKLIMKNRRILTIDEERMLEKAQKVARDFVSR
ncbi:MAG: amidohydrolase [Candidatus Methanofastidiosia archaeon]